MVHIRSPGSPMPTPRVNETNPPVEVTLATRTATGYRARPRRTGRMDRWRRAAYIAWGFIIVAGVGRATLYHLPRHCGCYDVFADGGRHWLAAEPVYDLDHLES